MVADHLARYDFAKNFVKEKTVLDIACGEGYGSALLKQGGAKEVYGADLDQETIRRAAAKYPGVKFVVADATKTPFENNFFDAVFSFETWHHLDKYEDFIPEMRRVLKPGGLLLLSVPNEKVIYLNPLHRKFMTKFYRFNFSKDKITKFLNGYFSIERWYGQRFVRKFFLNPLVKFFLYLGCLLSGSLKGKVIQIFNLADGAKVRELHSDNARYLVALCRKRN